MSPQPGGAPILATVGHAGPVSSGVGGPPAPTSRARWLPAVAAIAPMSCSATSRMDRTSGGCARSEDRRPAPRVGTRSASVGGLPDGTARRPTTSARCLVRALAVIAPAWLLIAAVVDRVEGDVAAVELEDLTIVDLPLVLLPPDIEEGDRLELQVLRKRAPSARRAPRRALRPAPTTDRARRARGESR